MSSRPFRFGPHPFGWRATKLREFLWRRRETGRSDLPLLSVNLTEGVRLRETNDGRTAPSLDLSGYQIVHCGDLVVNQLGKPHGSLGVSPLDGIISPAYFVCGLKSDVEPRFIHHLVRTRLYISEYERRGKWMPPSQFDISWAEFRDIDVILPPRVQQRVIADFLDAETTRIDTLIAKKRRLISVIEERFKSQRDQQVARLMAKHGRTAVRRLADGVEQGWSPSCENRAADADEWGVLKTSAVTHGVFRGVENKRLPHSLQPDLRWVVADGDVLVARGSGSIERVGTAAVATPEGRNLMISDLIYRLVRPRMNSALLAHFINSSVGRTHLESSVRADVGQTLKIRGDDLMDTPVPWVPPNLQAEALEEVERNQRLARKIIERLSAQLTLLAEHRQALITAAVTGQLKVPGGAA